MEQTRPFYDFSIPYNKDDKVMRGLLNELVELGYKTIAIDQSFDHSKKEAGKRGSEMFPEPYKVEHLRKEFRDQLRILQRITILYVDVNVAHAMGVSLNLRKFNIIAGQPKTDAALTLFQALLHRLQRGLDYLRSCGWIPAFGQSKGLPGGCASGNVLRD
nr:uncharacterized protein LOC108016756 isoform X2 [Drosophila suzukii]